MKLYTKILVKNVIITVAIILYVLLIPFARVRGSINLNNEVCLSCKDNRNSTAKDALMAAAIAYNTNALK